MKKILFVVACALVMSAAAFADSQIKYAVGPAPKSIYFPNHGLVRADQVCLDQASQTLKTFIPEQILAVCDATDYRPNRAGYMVETCIKSHNEVVPAKNLVAPLQYMGKECAVWNRDDSTHPICKAYQDVLINQELEYRVNVYNEWDYRRESPWSELRKVGFCQ